jgi:hypothetical protein
VNLRVSVLIQITTANVNTNSLAHDIHRHTQANITIYIPTQVLLLASLMQDIAGSDPRLYLTAADNSNQELM